MNSGSPQPARILVLASTYPRWSGDSLPPFVHELARRLTKDFEVHALVPHAAGAKVYELMDGVHVHRFHYLPERFETLAYTGGILPGLRRRPWRLFALPLFLMLEFMAALRLLRRQRFILIHAHWLLPHGLIAVLARKLCGYRPPLVCTAHGTDIYALRGGFARALKRYTVAHSDWVTVVSQAMLGTLRQYTHGDRSSVLPMGVDTRDRFTSPPRSQPRSDLLFVGRLTEQKGASILLKALVYMPPTKPRLRIAGSGPDEAYLRQQTLDAGLGQTVDFLGPLANQDLPKWYRQSAVLVFPSIRGARGDQEGLGLVPIEAMACGCTVVASDQPGIRDVVRHGETGWLVKPGDPAELAAALQTLLEDQELRDRLAAQGRAYVQAHFDWVHIAGRYAELFYKLEAEISRSATTAP